MTFSGYEEQSTYAVRVLPPYLDCFIIDEMIALLVDTSQGKSHQQNERRLHTTHARIQMLSVGNAVAAGMMLSASYSLVTEGIAVEEEFDVGGWLSAGMRVAAGVLAGLMFILSTKQVRVH